MPAGVLAVTTSGNVQTGELETVLTTTDWQSKSGTLPGVIMCHGAGGTGPSVCSPSNFMTMMWTIAQAGYPIVSADLGGNTWGNATVQSRISAAKTFLQGTKVGAKSGKVIIMAQSMGNVGALNYARDNAANVSCVIGVLPVCDMDDIYQNNRGSLRTQIQTAWGITYPTALPANANPATSHSGLENIPILLFYASDDAVVIPSTVTTLASAIGATTVNVGTGGHTDATLGQVNTNTVINFMNAHA